LGNLSQLFYKKRVNILHIDHIGIVVNNIEEAIQRYTVNYGFVMQNQIIYDDNQHVRLVMLISSNRYKVELIQPLDEKSPSFDFLQKGGGIHHICYVANDIEKAIVALKKNGHLLFKKPIMAPLLTGKKVAFLFSKTDKQIIELVEMGES
jgi:methylmalonyl-CoA/ethylmalonyl-CoA epimerase